MLNEYPHFNTEPKSFIRPKMGKIVDEMGIFSLHGFEQEAEEDIGGK